ncbi:MULTISPECIES: TetR/AcrR family transcriptional regulator [Kitasatospora]|uniref:TetR/AcrR family transcriptional regulator n=1 Tax=Kitasatospora TaxID=2063 RepID=UPI000CB71989|nr:TetR/AcrR family transcriptional regulator [Kitasatospora sp. GP30]MDH6140244.1 AcrR family transcriptional regulator [Kitasatospora sp. GP30]
MTEPAAAPQHRDAEAQAAPGASGAAAPRRRDAARSRELLLQAAMELFADRGFDRTTIREIGERAGVDPALIARYFGSKVQLYLAAVRAEQGDQPPADLLAEDRLHWLLNRFDRRGLSPSFPAMMLPGDNSEVQRAARAHIQERLVDPLRERLATDGVERAELRAEVATAALAGVLMARSSGAFAELSAVDAAELEPLLRDLLQSLRA